MFLDKILKRSLLSLCICLGLGIGKAYAQVTDGMTGLLHMPNAEMQRDGTFMMGGNYLNGPAIGVNFRPAIHRNLNLIVEYDAKTVNVGATYALWADHFNLMVELQEGKYLSAGLVYKVNLLGNNRWKAKLFDY